MKIQVKFNFEEVCNNLLLKKLNSLHIKYRMNSMGEIEILQPLSLVERQNLFNELNSDGVNVVDDPNLKMIYKVKSIIEELIKGEVVQQSHNLSYYLEQEIPYSYTYISKNFSEVTHMSIEQFFILKKIDYVKELLSEKKLSLSEIAFKLNYSSVSHLSNQFKKTTGFNPSQFLDLKKQLESQNSDI